MTVDAIGSCGSTVQAVAGLIACRQMRLDFFEQFSAIADKDLAGAQIALAVLQQEHGSLTNKDNTPLSTNIPCFTNASVDPFSWSVLLAGSLFASQEKKSTSLNWYSSGGAGRRGMTKKQYKCSKCGNSVVVDLVLESDEQECQICGAHLAYMGSG